MRGRGRSIAASVLLGVALLAALVAANVLASRSTRAWDLTRYGNNTLAPQSVLAAHNLTSDLQVIGLFRPTQPGDQAVTEALIALYAQQSPHVLYRSANVDTDVADVKRYSVTEADTVVLDYNGKTQLLLPGSQTEQDFTSSLLKLESSRVPMVCWAVGDGERELSDVTKSTGYSSVESLLTRNNFAHRDLILAQATAIPTDCDELVVLDPTTPIGDKPVAAVDAYLAAGGRLLIAAEPWAKDTKSTAALNAILKPYGVAFSGALVVEADASRAAVQDPTIPVVINYGQSPITSDVQGVQSFFPRSTAITGTPPAGTTAAHLAVTTTGAYGIPQIRQDVTKKQAGDASGPFTLMETLEQSASESSKTRIVLVGTQSFAENATLPPNNGGANLELALASFQWLAGEDALIALPPKPGRALPLVLTQQDQSNIIFITAVLMPGIIVVAGIAVWWRRRIFT
ncbi:MAG TPA: Gldg family protein [Candidatus Polarisedimenticolia bacterium]|nr:Gldg family protein [Candidatus Polarisedimenticolia bacterium]